MHSSAGHAANLPQSSPHHSVPFIRPHSPTPLVLSLLLSILCHFQRISISHLSLLTGIPSGVLLTELVPYLTRYIGEESLAIVNVEHMLKFRRNVLGHYNADTKNVRYGLDVNPHRRRRSTYIVHEEMRNSGAFWGPSPNVAFKTPVDVVPHLLGKQVQVLDLHAVLDWCEYRNISIYPIHLWERTFGVKNMKRQLLHMNGMEEWMKEDLEERQWWQRRAIDDILRVSGSGEKEPMEDEESGISRTSAVTAPETNNSMDTSPVTNETSPPKSKSLQEPPIQTSVLHAPTIQDLLHRFSFNEHLRSCLLHYCDLAPSRIANHWVDEPLSVSVMASVTRPISAQVDSLLLRLCDNVITQYITRFEQNDSTLVPLLFHFGNKDEPQVHLRHDEYTSVRIHCEFLASLPTLQTICERESQQIRWSDSWYYLMNRNWQDSTLDYFQKFYHTASRQQKDFFTHFSNSACAKTRTNLMNPIHTDHSHLDAKMSLVPRDPGFVFKMIFFESRCLNMYRRVCDHVLKSECDAHRALLVADDSLPPCEHIHYRKMTFSHTQSEKICGFKSFCRYMKTCKFSHLCVDERSETTLHRKFMQRRPLVTDLTIQRNDLSHSIPLFKFHSFERTQWLCCDLRYIDFEMLGKFDVIMADPPWDISVAWLSYGTLSDQEIPEMRVDVLQDHGYMFLWVTMRTIEIGIQLLKKWGYSVLDQHLIWIKVTNDHCTFADVVNSAFIVNHTKEHCLIGRKGDMNQKMPGWLDVDVIMSVVRESSRKPTEIYSLIERLCPHGRKLELFGRDHNRTAGWFTLGNQLSSSKIVDPALQARLEAYKREGGKGLIDVPSLQEEKSKQREKQNFRGKRSPGRGA